MRRIHWQLRIYVCMYIHTYIRTRIHMYRTILVFHRLLQKKILCAYLPIKRIHILFGGKITMVCTFQ